MNGEGYSESFQQSEPYTEYFLSEDSQLHLTFYDVPVYGPVYQEPTVIPSYVLPYTVVPVYNTVQDVYEADQGHQDVQQQWIPASEVQAWVPTTSHVDQQWVPVPDQHVNQYFWTSTSGNVNQPLSTDTYQQYALEDDTEIETESGAYVVDSSPPQEEKELQRILMCNHCDAVFSDEEEMTKHIEQIKRERPYKCSYCNKRFRLEVHLRRHTKTHTEPPRFQCTTCGKRFRRKDNLQSHERLHTGEKPFKCEECSKEFRHYSSLINHRRTHTKQTVVCKVCNQKLSSKPALKVHMKNRHSALEFHSM